MGLTGVTEQLRKRYARVFYKHSHLGLTMLVSDIMTSLFNYAGVQLTCTEIYSMLLKPYKAFFAQSNKAHLIVLIADKSSMVPVEKRSLQQKRYDDWHSRSEEAILEKKLAQAAAMDNAIDEDAALEEAVARAARISKEEKKARETGYAPPSKNFTKYPEDCEICPGGIKFKDGHVERVVMDRLMFTRSLRPAFYKFLVKSLVTDPEWPDNTRIITDFPMFNDTPQLLCPRLSTIDTREDLSCLIPLPDLKNQHGEAEKACIWWANLCLLSYPGESCIIRAEDSDVLPMMAHAFWDKPELANRIHWISKTDRCMLGPLIARLRAQGMTWQYFVAACIVSGCDYFAKEKATFFVGHDTIWDAAIVSASAMKEPPNVLSGYGEFLRSVYAMAYTPPPPKPAKAKKPPAKRKTKAQKEAEERKLKKMSDTERARLVLAEVDKKAEAKRKRAAELKLEKKEAADHFEDREIPRRDRPAPSYEELDEMSEAVSRARLRRPRSDADILPHAKDFFFAYNYWCNRDGLPSAVSELDE